ncbi:hypothetical protein EWM64_g9357 [Hericium alpestre]|uniref:Glucose-methanol-choline oxidoreductase N-terminal domain-containing protein n=1 Tax=Hericium alpestre TaxID=135208 RepID=A0A4Y9ZJ93_9AGAM|nr:hypothetical protein EWM64_g9357 [Hericium alpestre]
MWPFSHSVPELKPHEVGTCLHANVRASAVDAVTYDYIIVGGGSAGCCLASRLSEDPSVTVLLLERGNVTDTWASKVPLISSDLFRSGTPAARWTTQPMPEVDGRTLEVVRGEALGGTSRVNGLVYTRGAPGDYNLWKELGHEGWGYDDLLPYFVKSEKTLSQPPSSFRGSEGPWQNQTFKEVHYKFARHILSATQAIGIPPIQDVNSPKASAAGHATLDICVDRNIYRASTYRAFLPPNLAQARKKHLKICTDTVALRIETETSSGKVRAVGVHFGDVSGNERSPKYYAKAQREVILCAGALGSPQLLQLSGLGPADHLKEKGIPVVRDMPGVGSHLQDHPGVPVMYEVPVSDTLFVLEKQPLAAMIEFLKYVTIGRGLFVLPFTPTSIFVPSRLLNKNSEVIDASAPALTGADLPDIEIMPIPYNASDVVIDGKGIFSLLGALIKPKSVGTQPRGLHHPAQGLRLALRIAEQVRTQGYLMKDLQVPETENEVDMDRFIRKNMRTTYHYASTCRMAREAEGGVVDDDLRVYGVQGLRVCDTSVFPEIVATHLMAPAVVVAEKCADLIKTTWK